MFPGEVYQKREKTIHFPDNYLFLHPDFLNFVTMKAIRFLSFFVSAAFLAVSCNSGKPYEVKVSGQGIDFLPDSSYALVWERGDDIRFDPAVAYSFITGGKFELSFTDSLVRTYDLYLSLPSQMQFFQFFSDKVPVKFTFSNGNGDIKADVDASEENEEIYVYRDKWDEMFRVPDSLYNEYFEYINEKYIEPEADFPEEGTDEYNRLKAWTDSIAEIEEKISPLYREWQLDRMRTHKSLAALEKITGVLESEIGEITISAADDSLNPVYLELFNEYKEIYPDNPMVRSVEGKLAVMASLRPGKPAPDFSAPSLNGSRHSLSELIEGKVAVLDCWASWCAPCRRHSIELIPLYEKYKDKGFTIVGVAREYETLDDMKEAIESDGYPWIQLYDLDGAEGVWPLYGLSDAGGGIFLIDREGKIVRHVVEIKEVEEYLEDNL